MTGGRIGLFTSLSVLSQLFCIVISYLIVVITIVTTDVLKYHNLMSICDFIELVQGLRVVLLALRLRRGLFRWLARTTLALRLFCLDRLRSFLRSGFFLRCAALAATGRTRGAFACLLLALAAELVKGRIDAL